MVLNFEGLQPCKKQQNNNHNYFEGLQLWNLLTTATTMKFTHNSYRDAYEVLRTTTTYVQQNFIQQISTAILTAAANTNSSYVQFYGSYKFSMQVPTAATNFLRRLPNKYDDFNNLQLREIT